MNLKRAIWIIIILAIIILPIAWYLISPIFKTTELNEDSPIKTKLERTNEKIIESSDSMPNNAQILAQGIFIPSAHEVKGKALVISENNKKILRFEDFETINGPDLHIYLSSDLESKDSIDLGSIKATKGNVNYEIPEGIDTEKYNKVLIWCVPFKVLFSHAELN